MIEQQATFWSSGTKTFLAFLIIGCGFNSSSENLCLRGLNSSPPGTLDKTRSVGSGWKLMSTSMASGSMGDGVLRSSELRPVRAAGTWAHDRLFPAFHRFLFFLKWHDLFITKGQSEKKLQHYHNFLSKRHSHIHIKGQKHIHNCILTTFYHLAGVELSKELLKNRRKQGWLSSVLTGKERIKHSVGSLNCVFTPWLFNV